MADELKWETERYHPTRGGPGETRDTALAQLIYDTGLLYMVNVAVLHPHGLALGVNTGESIGQASKVIGLNLHRTSDPQGVWFDEELTIRAREKMQAAGILLGSQEAYPERMAAIREALTELQRLTEAAEEPPAPDDGIPFGPVVEVEALTGIVNAIDLILRGDPGCVEPDEVPWAGKRKF